MVKFWNSCISEWEGWLTLHKGGGSRSFMTMIVTKVRCMDLPGSDWGDFSCRRAVDSSSLLRGGLCNTLYTINLIQHLQKKILSLLFLWSCLIICRSHENVIGTENFTWCRGSSRLGLRNILHSFAVWKAPQDILFLPWWHSIYEIPCGMFQYSEMSTSTSWLFNPSKTFPDMHCWASVYHIT